MKKILVFIALIILPYIANAQLILGGGVEFREDGPDTGFNIRVQYPFTLSKFDAVTFNAGFRGSFLPTDRLEFRPPALPDDFDLLGQSYQFGAFIQSEFQNPLGFINPYGGLGLGLESNNVKVDKRNKPFDFEPGPLEQAEVTKSVPYIEVRTGIKLIFMPVLKPFAEFRYQENLGGIGDINLNGTQSNLDIEGNTRFLLGFTLELR